MLYFLDPQFYQNPLLLALFILSLSAVIYARYALVSVLYKAIVSSVSRTTRNAFYQKKTQILREMKWSLLSSLVFGALCAGSIILYHAGWTLIYADIDQYPLAYLLLSPLIVMLAYETYYYWLHRFMHHRAVYRIVHRVHHESVVPTVFTAFSFHPFEALLQFLFFPLIIMVMPLHLYALAVVFTFLTVTAMINHGGVELYRNPWIRSHVIGSSHHDLHHREFNTNFGLMLTWWDKVMKTSSKWNEGR